MAQVVASNNLKAAATNEGDALLIRKTKEAEAEGTAIRIAAEAERTAAQLRGQGVALFREEVGRGLAQAARELEDNNVDSSLILFSMWTESIRHMAENGKGNVLFLDGSPAGMEKQMQRPDGDAAAAGVRPDRTPTRRRSTASAAEWNWCETLPARWYTDPGVFERERWPIFGSAWVHVAYEHQLRRTGDYVAENLAGWPIFVRRSDDGSARGFYNLCPHRAGPIVWDGEGRQANMVCRYHGWAFRNDGTLLNARDFGVPTRPTSMDLTPIQVDSWRGMVFVCLDPDVPPLHEWLGDVPRRGRRRARSSRTASTAAACRNVACNWKTYGDNFMEGYHLPPCIRR